MMACYPCFNDAGDYQSEGFPPAQNEGIVFA